VLLVKNFLITGGTGLSGAVVVGEE